LILPFKNISIVLFVFSLAFTATAQRNRIHEMGKVQLNWDSTIILAPKQFDSLVNKSISVLKTQKLVAIKDKDHIDIIRLYNTSFMAPPNLYTMCDTMALKKFNQLLSETKYLENITKIYPDWIPSRGMGFYISKLQIEFGGTPHGRSYFSVIK
jgi:hypothetical protein